MTNTMPPENLLFELYSRISPAQFERFLAVLLEMMQFSDIKVTGRSGDRGIDLEATWTEANIPGLEIELPFKIQAKRFAPKSTLNPRYVRELRGTLRAGEWGLLFTTAKVSTQTSQESIADPDRVVSIIDGKKLIELCKKYGVGVKTEYKIDLSAIEFEEPVPPQLSEPESRTVKDMLTEYLGENFDRLGKSSIYKSSSKTVIARVSQRYERADSNYWYGTTQKDIERVTEYQITHFAYICLNFGVVLIPAQVIMMEIRRSNLGASMTKEGQIRHYHVQFYERDEAMFWNLKGRDKDISEFLIRAPLKGQF